MVREPHAIIMQICKIMSKLLCTKVYDTTTYEDLKIGDIYSLCLLEKVSPPTFSI